MNKDKLAKKLTVLELCAGGGGQLIGLEQAGFECIGAVEIERSYCETLILNRPGLNVINADLRAFDASAHKGVDLVAGGVPCPPFSVAGKQLGKDDDRDLFPAALKIIRATNPKAILLENVQGLSTNKFADYRENILKQLDKLGYWTDWKLLNASDYGVPQLRPRFLLVGIKKGLEGNFKWPKKVNQTKSVGDILIDLMAAKGWKGAKKWASKAKDIGPTLVGGSTKHGGPDLGPTRARMRWAELGVDGSGIADDSPSKDHPADKMPKLTVRMTARIQGFPDDWQFHGKKTTAYRQIGNAFPPPVARAVGKEILKAINGLQ